MSIEDDFLPRCKIIFCTKPVAVGAPLPEFCAWHLHQFAFMYKAYWTKQTKNRTMALVIEWSLKNPPEQSQS